MFHSPGPLLSPVSRSALRCMGLQAMGAACKIFAHLAYRFKNALGEELDRRGIATLQLAQIFLNIHHHYSLDMSNVEGQPRRFQRRHRQVHRRVCSCSRRRLDAVSQRCRAITSTLMMMFRMMVMLMIMFRMIMAIMIDDGDWW